MPRNDFQCRNLISISRWRARPLSTLTDFDLALTFEIIARIMPVSKGVQIPDDILDQLRCICLTLPEAYEEQAWVGIRWMIGNKNFAHVLGIRNGWPPAYARAAGTNGPVFVLTFRIREKDPDKLSNYPFFRPGWFPNIAGLVIDDDIDWAIVKDLITVSYSVLAPKKLSAIPDMSAESRFSE